MSDWQPIETAPKEEWVLLFWPYWNGPIPAVGIYCDGAWDSDSAISHDGDSPTYWMPLPPPPEAKP